MSGAKGGLAESHVVEEKVMGRLLVVYSVYSPNSDLERVWLLNELSGVLSQCQPEKFLFSGGDFNCTKNDQLDRNHVEPHAVSQRVMKQLVKVHGQNM